MSPTKTRKIWEKPTGGAKRGPKPGTKHRKNLPWTSAQNGPARSELTTYDWLVAFAWKDKNSNKTQQDVVRHFKQQNKGRLLFSQGALSRALARREILETRALTQKNGMSMKRNQVVTRPDIEKMLYEWCQHMNAKGEVFIGEMLVRKRGQFESLVQVPEDERLSSTGWIASFKRTYGIREIHMHGEAGSVDVVHVEQEQERVKGVLEHFNKRD